MSSLPAALCERKQELLKVICRKLKYVVLKFTWNTVKLQMTIKFHCGAAVFDDENQVLLKTNE